MNNEDIVNENNMLKEKILQLEAELIKVREHLKQYTAPAFKYTKKDKFIFRFG